MIRDRAMEMCPGGVPDSHFRQGKNRGTPPKLQGKNRGTPPLNSREKIEGPPLIVGENPSTPVNNRWERRIFGT